MSLDWQGLKSSPSIIDSHTVTHTANIRVLFERISFHECTFVINKNFNFSITLIVVFYKLMAECNVHDLVMTSSEYVHDQFMKYFGNALHFVIFS